MKLQLPHLGVIILHANQIYFMKTIKSTYYSLSFLCFSLLIFGCSKQNITSNKGFNTEFNNVYDKNLTTGVTKENGMLKFNNIQHVRNTLSILDSLYRANEDVLLNSYPNKTGQELMKIEDSIAFKEFQTYERFENDLAFNSLRKKIQNDMANYENTDLNLNNDPEDHYVFEYSVQAILNEHCEVKIGNSIYKFYEKFYIEIIDGDLNTLYAIRNNTNLIYSLNNVRVEGNENQFNNKSLYCEGHIARHGNYTTGGRRIKWRIAICTYPWNRYVIAESTNYIIFNNHWKKYRCHTKCRVWGDISDYEMVNDTLVANCDKPLNFNTENGLFSDKHNTKHWQHKIYVATRTKTNWVKGYHYSYIAFTTQYNSILDF